MVVCSITVVPLGTKSPSLSKYVAASMKVLQESGLKHQLTPMATIVEGELDQVLSVAAKMHSSLFSDDVVRVSTTIKIDERRDKNLTMEGKVAAVKGKL
ncbi:MAG: MTH1187 family thiamine-binding protein [Candidatus Coatesbacteria bacterium]|nr:MTH1187 family thiamine-binding protein [Candidatus Coatesbacteria bacterium]